VNPVHFTFPHRLREIPGLREIVGLREILGLREIRGISGSSDEHLLAGADEGSVQALGVSQPVLARFQNEIAVLCPDLVHEAQVGLGRM
jgi:hypothetical protein